MYRWTVVVKNATKLDVMSEIRTRCGMAQGEEVMENVALESA